MNIRAIHTKEEIAKLVEENTNYQNILFARGYFLTDDASIDAERYPFYGKWKVSQIAGYRMIVHPDENLFFRETEERVVALVGHAYSPFTMQSDENILLSECDGLYDQELWKKVAEWTGVFIFFVITGKKIQVFGDAGMIKMCHYCVDDGHFYLASHFQMIADLKNYPMCDYAKKIRVTRMYNTGMRWLPGDMTAYDKVHRLGANLMLLYDEKVTSIKRIYPLVPHKEANTEEEQLAECENLFTLLHNNVALCLQKWTGDKKVALSLTGGMDSGGEFACTKGLTEKLRVFSYDCKRQEEIDSEAAKKICEAVGVPHFQYHIPLNPSDLPCGEAGYHIIEEIIDHNTGYVKNLAESEIRKIAYFYNCCDFDVELKADVAEIGRAFYDQKYGMKMPRRFTPRQIAVLQTRFLFMPKLQRQTEQKYKSYNKSIGLDKSLFNYEHSDLLYWENRIAAAMGVSVQSASMAYLQTLPYNNRAILECMLAFPHELRRKNVPQQMLKENYMPKMIFEEAEVENKYLGKKRIILEKLFFYFKSIPLLGQI